MSCIGSAVVIEQLIISADLSVYLIHVILNNGRNSVIVAVAGFSCLEEDIAVLSGAAENRVLRIDSPVSEFLNSVHIYHRSYVFLVPYLDLLDLMRGPESVKEMKERYSSLNSRQMSYGSEIHYLLNV